MKKQITIMIIVALTMSVFPVNTEAKHVVDELGTNVVTVEELKLTAGVATEILNAFSDDEDREWKVGYSTTNLNIRYLPTTESESIGRYLYAEEVKYSEYDDDWHIVSIEGNDIGYVSSSYISEDKIEYNTDAPYMEYCIKYGEMYGVSPYIINAICFVESNYNPNVISKAGAVGVCQQIPKHVKEIMKELGLTDLTDPKQSIQVCAYLLNEFRQKGYEIADALTCYNRGEGGAKKYIGILTNYARKVLEKAYELEHENGEV